MIIGINERKYNFINKNMKKVLKNYLIIFINWLIEGNEVVFVAT